MSSNTKVVVFKAKELLYTGIFLLLGIILILLLIFMFLPKDNEKEPAVSTETNAVYVPGVYTSSVQLGENTLDVQVTVDSQNIKSVSKLVPHKSFNPSLFVSFESFFAISRYSSIVQSDAGYFILFCLNKSLL